MIRISAKPKHGFRRCGVFHPHAAVDHADDRFTDAELTVLENEPLLRVEYVDGGRTQDSGGGNDTPWAEKSRDEKELAMILAAKMALDDGQVTSDGKPLVEAMEEVLGANISAADRDRAFAALMQQRAQEDDGQID